MFYDIFLSTLDHDYFISSDILVGEKHRSFNLRLNGEIIVIIIINISLLYKYVDIHTLFELMSNI